MRARRAEFGKLSLENLVCKAQFGKLCLETEVGKRMRAGESSWPQPGGSGCASLLDKA